MVRSADQDTVENGLKLLEMISVKSSAESKVVKSKHGMTTLVLQFTRMYITKLMLQKAIFDGKVPNELVRLVKSRCVFSDAVVRKLLVVINNLSMSEDLPQIFGVGITDSLPPACTPANEELSIS